MLRQLREVGYEVGSGIMTGIPGQTYLDLAHDISMFHELDLDMIGIGPWIAHPETPLGREQKLVSAPPGEQVPNTEDIVYRVIALTRLVQPYANIPTTTALATLNKECGREQGMRRGANIIMPILTPTKYRQDYEIYPGKAYVTENAQQCYFSLHRRIRNMGRAVGNGPGSSPNFTNSDSAVRR